MPCFLTWEKDIYVNLVYELEDVVAICVVLVVYGREEGVTLTVEELLSCIGVSPKNSRDNLLLGYFLTVYQPRFACRVFHAVFASVIDRL